MTGKDMFVLVMTFITGVFAGVYLYVTAFAPSYEADNGVIDIQRVDFLLQGKKVGGCSQGDAVCPSFELRGDRTYTYLPAYHLSSGPKNPVEGKLGKVYFSGLLDFVEVVDEAVGLHALEEKTPDADCSPIYDTNYRYTLVYKGQMYSYDTCNTVFKESTLAARFYPLWTRLATSTPDAPLLEEGFSWLLENYLYKQFHDK